MNRSDGRRPVERRRRGSPGGPTATILIAAGVLAVAFVALALPWGVSAAPAGRVARVLNVHDEGHLHSVGISGSRLTEDGPVSGTIPGRVRVFFAYNGSPTVAAQFTIYSRYGSISGHGQGRVSDPASPAPSFRGALSITGGSGRYAHARGSGELFGVFYRRRLRLTVQAIGTLHY
jgi:hypothetical protein